MKKINPLYSIIIATSFLTLFLESTSIATSANDLFRNELENGLIQNDYINSSPAHKIVFEYVRNAIGLTTEESFQNLFNKMQMLLIHEIDPNGTTIFNDTVLHFIVGSYPEFSEDQQINLIKLFVDHGGDLQIANITGKTIYDYAIENKLNRVSNILRNLLGKEGVHERKKMINPLKAFPPDTVF